jgi:hypothetical protein
MLFYKKQVTNYSSNEKENNNLEKDKRIPISDDSSHVRRLFGNCGRKLECR